MEGQDTEDPGTSRGSSIAAETGPYVLRTLLDDLPLSADGERHDIEINCVEVHGVYNIAAFPTKFIRRGVLLLLRS